MYFVFAHCYKWQQENKSSLMSLTSVCSEKFEDTNGIIKCYTKTENKDNKNTNIQLWSKCTWQCARAVEYTSSFFSPYTTQFPTHKAYVNSKLQTYNVNKHSSILNSTFYIFIRNTCNIFYNVLCTFLSGISAIISLVYGYYNVDITTQNTIKR